MSAYDFCTDKARSFDMFRQFRYVLRFAVKRENLIDVCGGKFRRSKVSGNFEQ